MKIIILTAKFGMGHLSVSRALQEEILKKGQNIEVNIVDFYEYLNLNKNAKGNYYDKYLYNIANHPKIYNLGNDLSKHLKTHYLKKEEINKLDQLYQEYEPNLVISTFPKCSSYISLYKKITKNNIPLYTYVTDIDVFEEWLGIPKYTNYYFVGSKETKDALIKLGVLKDKVIVSGIPTRRQFKNMQKINNQELSILFMGGSMGLIFDYEDLYQKLLLKPNIKITIITGNNEELYHKLKAKFPNIQVLGFVNNVEKYMAESSLIVSKPGGITLFESINVETPLLIIKPLLSQEIGNAKYIENKQIGKVIWNPQKDLSETIYNLLSDKETLNKMQNKMLEIKESWVSDNPLDYYKE